MKTDICSEIIYRHTEQNVCSVNVFLVECPLVFNIQTSQTVHISKYNVFWPMFNGNEHKEFVLPGQTVNQQFYLKLLQRLHVSVQKKWPEMWSSGDWFLHHNDAPAHTAFSVQQFLAKNMTVIPHPPYSPELPPCNSFLFPLMKGQMKGKCFADVSEVKNTGGLEQQQHGRVPEMFFSSGKNIGKSVLSQKESTMREIRVVIV